MTRINIIPPKYLADQHLIAEIKEINQLGGSLRKSFQSKNFKNIEIPKNFTLNTGHVKFFYDKGKYLHLRFLELEKEALNRGFDIKASFYNIWDEHPQLKKWYNDWQPDSKSYNIIINRLFERIFTTPKSTNRTTDWYRLNKSLITNEQYGIHILSFCEENKISFIKNSPDPLLK